MNIIFVSSLDYNEGGAAQHRHHNFFKYLNNNNDNFYNFYKENIKKR